MMYLQFCMAINKLMLCYVMNYYCTLHTLDSVLYKLHDRVLVTSNSIVFKIMI